MHSIILKSTLVLILLFSAWRILVLGVSDHYVDRALDGDAAAIDKALSWNSKHPKALYLKAKQVEKTAPDEAMELLRLAISEKPSDARPLAVMVRILAAQEKWEQADRLMTLATKRMPANKSLRLRAASYWVERQRLDYAIDEWAMALSIAPAIGNKIFPVLTRVADNENIRELLRPLTQEPPEWWEKFFLHLSRHAVSHATVMYIANLRRDSNVTFSKAEREMLVTRLKKDNQWGDAYLAWVEGLTNEQRRVLGGVYNGGFELEGDNSGFEWYLPSIKNVSVKKQRTFGVEGQKALKVSFKGKEFRFNHLYQPMFLAPGTYQFSYMKRTDKLHGRGRLQWTIRCAEEPVRVIGQSKQMIVNSEWNLEEFEFHVPRDNQCTGQLLRLETVGNTPFDHKLSGDIWFDKVSVVKIRRNT
jgi:tetratricopeptide (TPR) repeat protein